MIVRSSVTALVLLALALSAVALRCPSPEWFYRNSTGSCYYVQGVINPNAAFNPSDPTSTQTWDEAVLDCKVRGGKIATFENSEELDWIRVKLNQYKWYWFGLTYENLKWEWYDGETRRPFVASQMPSLNVLYPEGTDAFKKSQRASFYYNSTSGKFGFDLETASSTNKNGYICKGDWSKRPWCRTEDGWSYRDGNCYKYYPTPYKYTTAESVCRSAGGYISVPSTELEDTRMKTWLRNTLRVERAWLGISIRPKNATTTNETVKWADGSSLTGLPVNNWVGARDMGGYIRNLTNGQNYCGEMTTREGSDYYDYGWYGWFQDEQHDWALRNNCDIARPFACEAPINKCPYGWQELGDQCYQINSGENDLRTWSAARAECKKQNADLVTIPNQAVRSFLDSNFYRISDRSTNHYYWIGLESKGSSFTWVNSNDALSFTNWNPGQPTSSATTSCVFADGRYWNYNLMGKWNSTSCTQKINYICQAPTSADILYEDVIHPGHTCQKPFTKFHEGCYLVVNLKKNRDEAQSYCQAQNSSVLGMIYSFGENNYVRDLIAEDSWIGLQIVRTSVSSGSPKFVYEYSDGSDFGDGSYKNFDDYTYASSESQTTEKYCVVMAANNSQYNISTYGRKADRGKWYHAPCTDQRTFVCSHDGTPTAIRPPHEDFSDPLCGGAGWLRNGTNCYRIHTNTAPWRLAKQTCQNAGPTADLLWITTKQEEDYISNHLIYNQAIDNGYYSDYDEDYDEWVTYADNYWINFYADSATGNWYWPHRTYTSDKWYTPMSITNWGYGEPWIPSTGRTNPRCAYILTDHQSADWEATSCDDNHAFICKKVLYTLPTVQPYTPRPTVKPGQTLGCKTGYNVFDGRCVKWNVERKTWSAARSACKLDGGELFSAQNKDDLTTLARFAAGAWIGLSATNYPRIYTWSDGTPFTYTPWNVQSHNSTQNCGAFSGSQGFAMYSCSETKSFICEASYTSVPTANPSLPVTTPPSPQNDGCDRYGHGFHDKCYYMGEDPMSTWSIKVSNTFDAASTFCKTQYNGNLVVINDREEEEIISNLIARYPSDYWIGLRQATTSSWSGGFSNWIDNTYVSVTNWANLEPKILTGTQRCVAAYGTRTETISPGDWYTDLCSAKKYAICEAPRAYHPAHPTTVPPITTPRTTTPKPATCPNGWSTKVASTFIPNDEVFPFCYKAYLGTANDTDVTKVTWQEAESFCRRFRGGHLATIDTSAQQTFITYKLLNSMNKNAQVWIGLRQTGATNKWEWVDGKALTSTNFWHTTEKHETDQPDCVALEIYLGKWIPQSCQQAWGWICEIPIGTYTQNELIENYPAAIASNATCGASTSEGDWFYSAATDECLYFSRKPQPWNTAQSDCREMGSNLVTVSSSKTHDFIRLKSNQFAANPTPFWIGLYQTDPQTLAHNWVDRHVSLYRAWEDDEPTQATGWDLGSERCVAHNSWSGKWKDQNCGRTLPFICLKSDRVPHAPPTDAPSVGACAPDWVEYRGSCYYLSGPENKTFAQANIACTKELTVDKGLPRGDLVSIHSSVENDFLVAHARRRQIRHGGPDGHMFDFWIGLRDHDMDNTLVWTDQSPVDYNNWHVKEPIITNYADDCIVFGSGFNRAGRWSNEACTLTRGYICKAPKNPSGQPVAPPPTKCSPGYTPYGENCFIVQKLDAGQKTWQNAQDKCKSLGDRYGDIATIVDTFENAELRVLFHELMRSQGVWHSSAWMGMQEHNGSYVWHNTCPVLYSNFENFYSKPREASSCAQMLSDGKWNSSSCTGEADYVLCERRFVPCPAVHNETDDNVRCPDDFPHECNRACYYVSMGTSQHDNSSVENSITTARAACVAKGGHLGSIRSEDDQQCLTAITKQSTQPLWIGLYEKKEGSASYSWVWETDEEAGRHPPVTYLNWEEGKPKIYEYSRDTCVQMLPTGQWANRYCSSWSSPLGFVCERRKDRREGPGPGRRTTTLPPPTGTRSGGDSGPSGGAVAGIVIGVLLAVALVAAVAYVVLTGKTQTVLTSVRSAGTRMTTSATNRMGAAGFSGFSNTNYADTDKVRMSDDPEFRGNTDSYS